MAVASNGQLAVGRYGEIQLGEKSLKGIPGKVNAIAISPDAKWLAVSLRCSRPERCRGSVRS